MKKNIKERDIKGRFIKGSSGFLGPHSIKTRKKMSLSTSGENHPNWKNGIWFYDKLNYHCKKLKQFRNKHKNDKKYREEIRLYKLNWRHKTERSKKYNSRTTGIKYSKKQQNQAYKRRVRCAGKLPLRRIQLVYEDNIKKYGTLTCTYCESPIQFSNDTLDHKIPLSRGGTNHYDNLTIACNSCNCKKHDKTDWEYKNQKGI